MLSVTLTTALRALSRHKRASIINLIGLVLGIAVFLTMALIVRYEYAYDRSIPRAAHIFQVDENLRPPGEKPQEYDSTSFVPFPFLKQDFPDITASTYLMQTPLVVRSGRLLMQETVTMTNSMFFSVFDLPLLYGDKATALDSPGKIVISAAMARKYFGTTNALGRRFRIDNSQTESQVTGILSDPAPNSTTTFDFVEITPSIWLSRNPFVNWGSNWGTIWLRIDDLRARSRIEQGLAQFVTHHPGDWTPAMIREVFGSGGLELIPLTDVHFHNAAIGEDGNSRTLVNILGLVGAVALATAIINYVNLATARSALRAREVAMRKVLGASRSTLVFQFMSEALALVTLAGLLGLALTELSLRWVNLWGGWQLSLDWSFVLPAIVLIVAITGLVAGAYPALVLSSFRPASVLAASKTPAGGRLESGLRGLLVVAQFSFAITLAICTLIMTQQAAFVRHLDRGMQSNGLITIEALDDTSLMKRQSEIIHRLADVPGVSVATRSDMYPHHIIDQDDWRRVGQTEKVGIQWGKATPGYFQAIGAHLIAGRLFDDQHGQDYPVDPRSAGNGTSVVISRLAAERFGFASPEAAIGHDVQEDGDHQTYRIIGVIEDIRFRTARAQMAPLLYMGTVGPVAFVAAIVRYHGASPAQELDRLRTAWAEVAPDVAFSAQNVSEIFADDYRTDVNHGALFGIGSAVGIGIACLGLYGLSNFAASRRMQEIGIRKVMGARTRDILALLAGQFLRPVLMASLIGWPISWGLMRNWLSGFDQRITLTPIPFLLVTCGALVIAGITVISQTLRAAQRPVAMALRQMG